MQPISTPVLIVGGGPVGLCLALFLNYWEVPCTIINHGASSRMHPKGNGQNARTMEHYRQLGIVDEIRKLGLPNDHPFDQAFFTRFSKHEIYRYKCASWNEREKLREKGPATDQFVEPMFHANQMYVERFLFERIKECKSIDVRFGWDAVDFVENKDGVTVHASKVDNTDKATWFTEYLVDCSGGKSFTRRRLDIDYIGDVQTNGAHWAGQFYNVWLRIPELNPKYLGHRRAWMNWAVNEDPETRGVLVALNGEDEFLLMVKPGVAKDSLNEDQVRTWVSKSIGADIDVEILAYAPWTAGAALAVETYKVGRIFLAGDAAHLFTPVGAFGMNTGIDDVHNLSWKLAAVLKGWGGPRLLDSYEAERKPIGFRNTGACRKYSVKQQGPNIPPDLEDDTPGGEMSRANAGRMSYIAGNHFLVPEDEDCTGVQLGARYDGSPLIRSDTSPPQDKWPETFDRYHPSSIPGGRVPHIWLDGTHQMGSSIYDRLGKWFTLIRISRCPVDIQALEKAAGLREIPLKVLHVAVPEAADLYERCLMLVRPDQYIAWGGDTLPDDCDALLKQVCGF